MTDTAIRAVRRARDLTSAALSGERRASGTRHPLAAAAMAVPPAVLLVVAFGGWHAVVIQASSVAGLMGR
ncbi:hypothetical protein NGB36_19480 [Streptomyces sp. RB6PN25]|uniref:Uncharacterized protein n=1 Tax=Streptomyces humicola TaxID=2953240 RepID=A0ABT1PYG6_9ACTN|nr:hypothetical protein [Streptomyces humicola]MCQ4082729.1 hypothetical protein [Streptomyces humicola]